VDHRPACHPLPLKTCSTGRLGGELSYGEGYGASTTACVSPPQPTRGTRFHPAPLTPLRATRP